MLKGLGLLLWFFASSGFGFSKAAGLRRRVTVLRRWNSALGELSFLLRSTAGDRERLLRNCFADKGLTESAEGKFRLKSAGLLPEDCAVLQPFLTTFGRRDTLGEQRHIEATSALLQRQIQSAEQCLREKEKIFYTAGVCVGLGGCLLLG